MYFDVPKLEIVFLNMNVLLSRKKKINVENDLI